MTVGEAVGFCAVVDDRPVPLQVYTVAPPDGLALRVTVPPGHLGPLLVGAAVGVALTVAAVV